MAYEHPTDEKLERSTNRVMLFGVLLLAALAAMFPLYRAVEPVSREEARATQEASLAAEGEKLFQLNCASCHGASGEGIDAPALNSQQFLQAANDEQIGVIVAVGIPGTEMNAYSIDFGGPLTSEQIRSIVSFLRSLEPDAPDRPDWRDMIPPPGEGGHDDEPGAEPGHDEEPDPDAEPGHDDEPDAEPGHDEEPDPDADAGHDDEPDAEPGHDD